MTNGAVKPGHAVIIALSFWSVGWTCHSWHKAFCGAVLSDGFSLSTVCVYCYFSM